MERKGRLIYRAQDVYGAFRESIRNETALPKHPQARKNYLLDSKETFEKEGDRVIFQSFPRQQLSRNAMTQGFTKEAAYRDAVMARPRYYDPIRSFTLLGIPFQMQLEAERKKIRQWCRFYIMTHHLVATLIEIFARFPLVGFENTCKDRAIKEYFDELFLDENRLDYENFLVNVGLEYWGVGEAFAFGEFDETLGVWVSDELIDPDLVIVDYYPLLKTRNFKLKIPEHLKDLVNNRTPKEEYEALVNQMPEIISYIRRNEPIPLDNELMYQMKCGGAPWETHGYPMLMRAFRQLMLEEKLNMSQMAIAERLYLPLLLAKLGTPGYGEDNTPWIPTEEQLAQLRDDIELAMSSDFRLICTHWAVDFQPVFGREVVPDMTSDYEQIERRILSVFGVSPALISGEPQQPYASTALNADLLNQRLKSYQKEIKRFVKERYRKVAEAQGLYDYEKKGDRLIPLYDEYLVYDPETGEKRVETRRKLLYPEPIMRVLDLRDEATQRQFLFDLREAGIPVADSTMLIGVEFEFEEELEKRLEEERKKIIAQQRSNLQLYNELKKNGYPIPQWLKDQVAGLEAEPPEGGPVLPMEREREIPGAIKPIEPMELGEGEGEGVIAPLRSVPEESFEQMETMPKP